MWLAFIGGAAVTGTKDRAWFVARLAKGKANMELHIQSWEDAKRELMRFYWVENIHGEFCRVLWEDALMTADVLLGVGS